MLYCLVFILGIVVGVLFVLLIIDDSVDGTLHVNQSDPDGTYMFMELKTPVHNVTKKQQISLKIDTRR